MDELRLFLNRLKCLYFIDRDELEALLGKTVSNEVWTRFRDDPLYTFAVKYDDERQAALWKRMTEQYPGPQAAVGHQI